MNKYGTYIIELTNGQEEEYDIQEVQNYIFANKKLKDMDKRELMIHLYTVGNLIDRFNDNPKNKNK